MIDLHPSADRMLGVVISVGDDQLGHPTPCGDASVGDLIDHVGVFAVRFAAAARKETDGRTSPPPRPSGDNLEPGWRDRISRDLATLADAWGDPRAWTGSTFAGGLEMPGEVVGLVAIDELVVHGWDIAVSTGQNYQPLAPDVNGALAFVTAFDAPRDGRLFGPVVPVADDAGPFDRLLGLTGRDPSWRPPA
jgi:uncharacterized protein (TIGR03086 family)